MDWIYVANDGKKWLILLSAVIKLRVIYVQNARIFFDKLTNSQLQISAVLG